MSLLQTAYDVLAPLLDFLSDPMHWLLAGAVLFVVHMHYRHVAVLEYTLYGWPKHRIWEEVAVSAINGIAVGILVSLLWGLSGLGLTLPSSIGGQELMLLLLVALTGGIGMLIKGRGAFSYAGAVVIAIRLLTGWPDVAPGTLLQLLGWFGLMEGLLILLSGATCATPLFLPGREGAPQGGFSLRRTWPVPFVLPLQVAGHLSFFPLAMVISYSDLAVTQPPAVRARGAGLRTTLYAAGVLASVPAVDRLPWLGWLAALYVVLGNFFLARPALKGQMEGHSFLSRPTRGVGVLDVMPGSVAEAAGMRTGVVILSVDSQQVHNRRELHTALLEGQAYVNLQFKQGHELRHCRLPRSSDGVAGLGAILLPEPGDSHVSFMGPSRLARWLARLRR